MVVGLLLGVGYSAHALLYSSSLARLDPGVVDMLIFTYPALVTVGAVLLRLERWSGRRALALASASAGTMLVLVAGLGRIDSLGAGLAVVAAVAYAAYILTSAGQLRRTDSLVLTAHPSLSLDTRASECPLGIALGQQHPKQEVLAMASRAIGAHA